MWPEACAFFKLLTKGYQRLECRRYSYYRIALLLALDTDHRKLEMISRTVRFFLALALKLSGFKEDPRRFFITLQLRRKAPTKKPTFESDFRTDSIAIVLQGPVTGQDTFCLETVELYREWYPHSPIIVSTWQQSDQSQLLELERLDCEVVQSDQNGIWPGISNSNYQSVSSSAGVRRAAQLGASYTLKTRTDQRFLNRESLPCLPEILSRYAPPLNNQQNTRIIVPSLNTFLNRLYGVTDMFMFGRTSDLLNYWDGSISEPTEQPHSTSLREYSMLRLAEVGFCASFLEKTGEVLDWTLEHYWKILSDRFVVLDTSFFDLYWPKYEIIENRWQWRDDPRFEEVTCAKWMLLSAGQMSPVESIIDRY